MRALRTMPDAFVLLTLGDEELVARLVGEFVKGVRIVFAVAQQVASTRLCEST